MFFLDLRLAQKQVFGMVYHQLKSSIVYIFVNVGYLSMLDIYELEGKAQKKQLEA